MNLNTPALPVHYQLPKSTQTHVHWVNDAIQPSCPLSSPSPPAFNLSQHQGLLQWVDSSNQVVKALELQLQHHFLQWILRVDLFRMHWFALLAVQGTLKSLLQHHSSKASILWPSVFFMVQCSHPYMTAGKTIALTRQSLVGKVMSLLFNMLSRLVIIFLPRSKHLLISWRQSPSAVILDPKNIKSLTVSIVSPSICHKVMGLDAMIFVFWMLSFKPAFSLFSFTFIKRLFSSSLLSVVRVLSSVYIWGYWHFSQQSWFNLFKKGTIRGIYVVPQFCYYNNTVINILEHWTDECIFLCKWKTSCKLASLKRGMH